MGQSNHQGKQSLAPASDPSETAPWQADVYAQEFIPNHLLAVNEAPAIHIPAPHTAKIDYASYISTFWPTACQKPSPSTNTLPHSEQLRLQDISGQDAEHDHTERDRSTHQKADYSQRFLKYLAREKDAHIALLEGHKLYAAAIDLTGSPTEATFRLFVPGLRDGVPILTPGHEISLRQLFCHALPVSLGKQSGKATGSSSASKQCTIQTSRGRRLFAGSTGYEATGVVQAIDRSKECVVFRADGLMHAPELFCNVTFRAPPSLYDTLARAVLDSDIALCTEQREQKVIPGDNEEQRGIKINDWMQKMVFPQESEGARQTELPSTNFGLEWYDAFLNYEQKKAVNAVVRQTHGTLPFLIYGPPGSGKTKTVCEILLQIVLDPTCQGTILFCAPSSPATDSVALRLRSHLTPQQMLRLYDSTHPFAEVPDALLPYCHVQQDLFGLPPIHELMRKRLVVTSCRDAAILVHARLTNRDLADLQHSMRDMMHPFDGKPDRQPISCHWLALVIDEAAQATEPETLIPLSVVTPHQKYNGLARPAFVMVGDEHQLKPRLYAPDSDLAISMFERLSKSPPYCTHPDARSPSFTKAIPSSRLPQQTNIIPPFVHLLRNYRSHPAILAVPSALFYANTLIPEASNVDSLSSVSLFHGKRYPILFDANAGIDECETLQHSGSGWCNVSEVRIAIAHTQSLLASGLVPVQSDICIMSPFPAQVRRLRQAARALGLYEVNIGPMEAFQGLESRVVIICTTRARKRFLAQDVARGLGIIGNRNKFNVAITRAKEALIVIGNPHTMTAEDMHWDAFLRFCHRNGLWTCSYKGPDSRMAGLQEQLVDPWTPTPRKDEVEEEVAAAIPGLEIALQFAMDHQHRESQSTHLTRQLGRLVLSGSSDSDLDREALITLPT